MIFVCFAGIVAIVMFIAYAAQDVEGASISVSSPVDVMVEETFELNVAVANERSKKTLELSDIDISEDYLAGFTVSEIDPKPKSNMHVPIDNSRSFTFDVKIPPNTTQNFVFTLRAEEPGLYVGDVDACEGLRFITDMAQTSVKEKE